MVYKKKKTDEHNINLLPPLLLLTQYIDFQVKNGANVFINLPPHASL